MDLKWLPFGLGRRHHSEANGIRRMARGVKSLQEKHGGELIAGAAVLSAVAAAISGTGAYLFERAVRLRRRPLAVRHEKAARLLAGHYEVPLETIEIPSQDGTALRSWYFRCQAPDPRRAVLLLHGQGENRSAMLPYARLLLRHGYNVLCVDHRGHGESGGEFSSYGFKEAQDVKQWVDWLKQERGQDTVFALGRSMGAAILLQALRLKPDLAAVVAEAPFASMREMAFDRVGQSIGAGSWLGRTLLRPVVESGIAYGRVRYGIDLGEATPEKAVEESAVPVLLIHGDEDSVIPVRHASRLLEHGEGGVEFWRVPGGEHCRALSRSPEEFERRVCAWFQAPALTE
ncbi:MAG TPA: alpha/beta fold hydrolase [Bryobacteraceae bacterium]|nr:alpha/beta fold hydrolase [Bryobacteraceae bacterium]